MSQVQVKKRYQRNPAMPGLSKEKRMELISAVKKYPILWVRDVKKSAKELNMTWDLVGREVRMDPTILREKWKYLTDTHRKEVYKHRYGNTGSRVSWPFYHAMEFVSNQYRFSQERQKIISQIKKIRLQKEPKKELLSPEHFMEDVTDSIAEDPLLHAMEDPGDIMDPSSHPPPFFKMENVQTILETEDDENHHNLASTSSTFHEKENIRGMICDKLRDIEELTHRLESAGTDDEDMQFLKSLHTSLASIPYPKKLLCRTQIQDLIYEFLHDETQIHSG
eukprot:TRINITY_DN2068_c0_g1_i1.p1 TRINITY_DN2068_c0_g1~~TRINITY_DN2068_c0_g1_i1.p1  ORF type:complete len:279 (-),score=85.68 TRINITY_DN2068_c0_g1_i1:217-1053(-)